MNTETFDISDVLPGGAESSVSEDTLPDVSTELKDINRYIVYMAAAGHSTEQIASMTGLHIQSIRRILKSPLVASEVKKLIDRVGKGLIIDRIRLLTPTAIDVLERSMDPNSKPEVQLRGAEDIFKLTGMMNGDRTREDTASYREILDRLDAVEEKDREQVLKRVNTVEVSAVATDSDDRSSGN